VIGGPIGAAIGFGSGAIVGLIGGYFGGKAYWKEKATVSKKPSSGASGSEQHLIETEQGVAVLTMNRDVVVKIREASVSEWENLECNEFVPIDPNIVRAGDFDISDRDPNDFSGFGSGNIASFDKIESVGDEHSLIFQDKLNIPV